jgi:hypothetical protein
MQLAQWEVGRYHSDGSIQHRRQQSNVKAYVDQFHDTRFGGDGPAVSSWIVALEAATGMPGLRALTYGSLGRVMSGRGSGAARRQWCPHCLDEALKVGETPYLRLLWTVGHVTACPIHKCRLVSVCQHCGEGETPSGRKAKRMSMIGPGACGSCHGWLGSTPIGGAGDRLEVPIASDEEVCIAQQVAGVLACPLADAEVIVGDEAGRMDRPQQVDNFRLAVRRRRA